MKKEKYFIFRIKDLQTGLYFEKEYWHHEIEKNRALMSNCQYKYEYVRPSYGSSSTRYLKFSQKGHGYKTKLGAERELSRFNGNTIHDRKTDAARLLHCKFNFIVVKTQIKYKDVKE